MYQDSKRLSPQRFKRFKLDGQAVQLVGMFALSGQLVSWSVGHVVVQQRIVRAALAVCVNVQPVRLPLFGTKRVSLLEGEAWLLRAV
jgi:hypothetical protein